MLRRFIPLFGFLLIAFVALPVFPASAGEPDSVSNDEFDPAAEDDDRDEQEATEDGSGDDLDSVWSVLANADGKGDVEIVDGELRFYQDEGAELDTGGTDSGDSSDEDTPTADTSALDDMPDTSDDSGSSDSGVDAMDSVDTSELDDSSDGSSGDSSSDSGIDTSGLDIDIDDPTASDDSDGSDSTDDSDPSDSGSEDTEIDSDQVWVSLYTTTADVREISADLRVPEGGFSGIKVEIVRLESQEIDTDGEQDEDSEDSEAPKAEGFYILVSNQQDSDETNALVTWGWYDSDDDATLGEQNASVTVASGTPTTAAILVAGDMVQLQVDGAAVWTGTWQTVTDGDISAYVSMQRLSWAGSSDRAYAYADNIYLRYYEIDYTSGFDLDGYDMDGVDTGESDDDTDQRLDDFLDNASSSDDNDSGDDDDDSSDDSSDGSDSSDTSDTSGGSNDGGGSDSGGAPVTQTSTSNFSEGVDDSVWDLDDGSSGDDSDGGDDSGSDSDAAVYVEDGALVLAYDPSYFASSSDDDGGSGTADDGDDAGGDANPAPGLTTASDLDASSVTADLALPASPDGQAAAEIGAEGSDGTYFSIKLERLSDGTVQLVCSATQNGEDMADEVVVSAEADTSYTLSIEIEDGQVVFYIDGEKVMTVAYPADGETAGAFAVFARLAQTSDADGSDTADSYGVVTVDNLTVQYIASSDDGSTVTPEFLTDTMNCTDGLHRSVWDGSSTAMELGAGDADDGNASIVFQGGSLLLRRLSEGDRDDEVGLETAFQIQAREVCADVLLPGDASTTTVVSVGLKQNEEFLCEWRLGHSEEGVPQAVAYFRGRTGETSRVLIEINTTEARTDTWYTLVVRVEETTVTMLMNGVAVWSGPVPASYAASTAFVCLPPRSESIVSGGEWAQLDNISTTYLSAQRSTVELRGSPFLAVGEAIKLRAGTTGDVDDRHRWHSSNPDVAVMVDGGIVIGGDEGTATITVVGMHSGAWATKEIAVTAGAESSNRLDKYLPLYESATYACAVQDAVGGAARYGSASSIRFFDAGTVEGKALRAIQLGDTVFGVQLTAEGLICYAILWIDGRLDLFPNGMWLMPATLEDDAIESRAYAFEGTLPEGGAYTGSGTVTTRVSGPVSIEISGYPFTAYNVTVESDWRYDGAHSGTDTWTWWLVRGLGPAGVQARSVETRSDGTLWGEDAATFITQSIDPAPSSVSLLTVDVNLENTGSGLGGFQNGDFLNVRLEVPSASGEAVDVYLVLLDDGGGFACVDDKGDLGAAGQATPFVRDWNAAPVQGVDAVGYRMANFTTGQYTWAAIFCRADADVLDTGNWLAWDTVDFQVWGDDARAEGNTFTPFSE